MFDIYVIGCGGIGGFLLQLLPQCLASVMLDTVDEISSSNAGTIKRDLMPGSAVLPPW